MPAHARRKFAHACQRAPRSDADRPAGRDQGRQAAERPRGLAPVHTYTYTHCLAYYANCKWCGPGGRGGGALRSIPQKPSSAGAGAVGALGRSRGAMRGASQLAAAACPWAAERPFMQMNARVLARGGRHQKGSIST